MFFLNNYNQLLCQKFEPYYFLIFETPKKLIKWEEIIQKI